MGKKKDPHTPGRFRKLVSTPEALADFRRVYDIPDDVTLELAELGAVREGSESPRLAPFSVLSIVEGGVRFPLHPELQNFLAQAGINPLQLLTRAYRILSGAIAMSSKIGARFGVSEILEHCSFMDFGRGLYYFRAKVDKPDLFHFLVDKDDHDQDFLLVGGNWEFASSDKAPAKRMRVKKGTRGPLN